jgi:hypothetical protein
MFWQDPVRLEHLLPVSFMVDAATFNLHRFAWRHLWHALFEHASTQHAGCAVIVYSISGPHLTMLLMHRLAENCILPATVCHIALLAGTGI